ncbi:MAG: 23S rRNA (pseudouridine(1915)-N(3))-methyltransferase RlmH [Saprospiraceae bacterium]|jgi:23S rRNA (pseudouridine1915-N3)-methyltransferase|nr:23S rRNA (pseudouridine(1915)-N(3))-methyltransferase RlmH [Saprospiraceae bacterium]
MKIECWFTGKTWEGFVLEGMNMYALRLKPIMPILLKEFRDVGTGPDAPEKEAAQIIKALSPNDILILLDENGTLYSSREFAHHLDKLRMRASSRIIFLAGGAYGFSSTLRNRSQGAISLSPMTFNHQLVRLVFLEQLYRAATILHNHPYHHD